MLLQPALDLRPVAVVVRPGDEVVLSTRQGMAIRFDPGQIDRRPQTRTGDSAVHSQPSIRLHSVEQYDLG